MSDAAALASGKSHRDENFPVVSLIAPRFRAPVLAFYNFVRVADDIADHATLSADEKLSLLNALETSLLEERHEQDDPTARALRRSLALTKVTPQHALDLLSAFKLDVTKTSYQTFDELLAYCRLSAMPVGRYVLDLHGESRSTWEASDALCAALQIINHTQDCGKDFRAIQRTYIPVDMLEKHGANIAMLGAKQSSPPLLQTLRELVALTNDLLAKSAVFPKQVRDLRLAMNVGAIQKLAESLTRALAVRDPLSQKVHASKPAFAAIALSAAAGVAFSRFNPFASSRQSDIARP